MLIFRLASHIVDESSKNEVSGLLLITLGLVMLRVLGRNAVTECSSSVWAVVTTRNAVGAVAQHVVDTVEARWVAARSKRVSSRSRTLHTISCKTCAGRRRLASWAREEVIVNVTYVCVHILRAVFHILFCSSPVFA